MDSRFATPSFLHAACAAGLTLVGAAVPAAAQQRFSQTVVVTASARPIELGSATRAMTVITREQIGSLPVHTVADVLRVATSVDVRARGVRGVQTDFVVRGAGFGQMLVLVDGVRLNDAQSGHHNGDIPVPLDAVDRIEILYGPGSSLFGADAFGGTINVITRQHVPGPALAVQGGSSGLAGGSAQVGLEHGRVSQSISASADRSSGFTFGRDFRTTTLSSNMSLGGRSGVSASYLSKEFGANQFYGNAPSREWTNQTLVSARHRFGAVGRWDFEAKGAYRTHGDHFIFDQFRPQLSDNRHRTHAALASLTASAHVRDAAVLTGGIESGSDWIRSTNLGDHTISRVSLFGEWRQQIAARVQLEATLRADRYSEFGTSWSPSAGLSWWTTPALRFRASAGRAFRVPTFTERYYSDPAHLARAQIGPETAWAGETGVDLFMERGWSLQATVFRRTDQDVIDWLRPTAAERWRTFNVRRVDTDGIELNVRKAVAGASFVQVGYTALDVSAPAVTQLSKYVLDYSPHAIVLAASAPLPARFHVSPRVEYRRRTRPAGASEYTLVDVRVGRRIGRLFDLFVDGTNLLDQTYEEIAGVLMPGAALSVSLRVGSM